MGIVSYAMLIVSGVYLTLGVIYLRFWWAERARIAYLAFTTACFAYMVYAWLELGMMRSATPEGYLFFTWWAYLAGTAGLLSFAWFAYVHLHGRKWFFWTFCAARVLGVIVHLTAANGIHFRQITAVGTRTVLDETLSYPIAIQNPWLALLTLSQVLLTGFFLDASVRCWRRGERRTALVFGTGTILFGVTTLVIPTSTLWGLVTIPLFGSFNVLCIVVAMLYELNYDMHRAAMLGERLAERENQLTETLDQLQLSAAAANVGLWTRRVGEEQIWFSEKAAAVWGFPSEEQVKQEDIIQHVYPADREPYVDNLREIEEWKNEYEIEYRFLLPDEHIRWIHSRGKVETVNGSRIIRGAIVDITNLKLAQEYVLELGGRLMNAQEKERARLARELHDDLSQSIALLAIQLGMLENEPKDLAYVKDQLGQLVSDAQRLSKDVHRISHELHPRKLVELGLETALRGFCSEFSAAHRLQIDLASVDVPPDLPQDLSLCLYRITQESLQNVIKHSGATSVHVSLRSENGAVRLSVLDNGKGFDLDTAKAKGGLGLVSIGERLQRVNGKVEITSAVGEGAKIEVRIPIV